MLYYKYIFLFQLIFIVGTHSFDRCHESRVYQQRPYNEYKPSISPYKQQTYDPYENPRPLARDVNVKYTSTNNEYSKLKRPEPVYSSYKVSSADFSSYDRNRNQYEYQKLQKPVNTYADPYTLPYENQKYRNEAPYGNVNVHQSIKLRVSRPKDIIKILQKIKGPTQIIINHEGQNYNNRKYKYKNCQCHKKSCNCETDYDIYDQEEKATSIYDLDYDEKSKYVTYDGNGNAFTKRSIPESSRSKRSHCSKCKASKFSTSDRYGHSRKSCGCIESPRTRIIERILQPRVETIEVPEIEKIYTPLHEDDPIDSIVYVEKCSKCGGCGSSCENDDFDLIDKEYVFYNGQAFTR